MAMEGAGVTARACLKRSAKRAHDSLDSRLRGNGGKKRRRRFLHGLFRGNGAEKIRTGICFNRGIL